MGVAASIRSEMGLDNGMSPKMKKPLSDKQPGGNNQSDAVQVVMEVNDEGLTNKLWRQEGTSLQQIQEGIFRHLSGTAYRTHKVMFPGALLAGGTHAEPLTSYISLHTLKNNTIMTLFTIHSRYIPWAATYSKSCIYFAPPQVYFAKHIYSKQEIKTMPYTFTHFVANVRATMRLYQELGVIPEEGHGPLRDLVECVDSEFERLKQRIVGWRATDKTPRQKMEHDRVFPDGAKGNNPSSALEQADAEAHSLHKKHQGKGIAARRGTQILNDSEIALPVDNSKHSLHDWEEGFGDEEDIPAEDIQFQGSEMSKLSYAPTDAKGQHFVEGWNQVCYSAHV